MANLCRFRLLQFLLPSIDFAFPVVEFVSDQFDKQLKLVTETQRIIKFGVINLDSIERFPPSKTERKLNEIKTMPTVAEFLFPAEG